MAPAQHGAAPTRRTSLRTNILANYIGRAYSLGANYLFIPFYIKILGIESYGLIAFYAVLLAITSIADVGLSATFSRQAAQSSNPAELAGMLATAERILLIGTTACAIGVFFVADWFAHHWLQGAGSLPASDMIWSLRLMALMLVPQLLFTLYSAGLLGLQHQVAANVVQALFITARAGLVILVITWRRDLTLFFGWQAVVTLVFAVTVRAMLLRRMRLDARSLLTFDWLAFKPHFGYAGGLLAITAISTLNTQLDKILISRFFSIAEFGYYNVASTLAQLPLAVAMPIGVAFFPRLVACVAAGGSELEMTFGNYVRLVAVVTAVGSMGLALFAPDILALWLHSPVPPIVPHIAAALAIGSLFLCLNTPPYYLCLAHGRSWLVVAVSLATLVVSLPCLLFGIGHYGLWGGALAWVVLNAVNFALLAVAMRVAGLGLPIGDLIGGTLLPVGVAAGSLLAARSIASAAGLGPLAACLVAAVGGVAAAGVVALFYRARLVARDGTVSG